MREFDQSAGVCVCVCYSNNITFWERTRWRSCGNDDDDEGNSRSGKQSWLFTNLPCDL